MPASNLRNLQAIKRMAEMIESVQKDMDRDMGWVQEAIASKVMTNLFGDTGLGFSARAPPMSN